MSNAMQLWAVAASSIGREAVKAATIYQEDVVSMTFALPGNPRIESVQAALTASGYTPHTLYLRASRGEPLPVSFLEALYGPQQAVQP